VDNKWTLRGRKVSLETRIETPPPHEIGFHFCHMSSVRGTSDGQVPSRGPVTRNRVPDREEKGKPINDARHGRCHPLE
jgi:hypothetical protein